MRASLVQLAVFSATAIRFVCAFHPPGIRRPPSKALDAFFNQDNTAGSDSDSGGENASKPYGYGTFEQYIDHDNPERGKFDQHYFYNAEFWGGPDSPVVVYSPGEEPLNGYEGYAFNDTLSGMIAQEVGGAVLVVEHRYFGKSSPFTDLTTANLQYLTLRQAVADYTRIAREMELPFDRNRTADSPKSNSPNAPWIHVGGSYGGNLGVWIEKFSSGTFWATHASSTFTEAIYDYWQYCVPIQNGMPSNCSCKYSDIIDYVDNIMQYGDYQQQADLKAMFGLQDVELTTDFVSGIFSPIFSWQEISPTDPYPQFYQMCDAIVEGFDQNSSSASYSPSLSDNSIQGVQMAVANYAKWFKAKFLPGNCASFGYPEWSDPYSTGCFDSLNATSPDNTNRSPGHNIRTYYWMLCNEPWFWAISGAPRDRPSLQSRLITPDYLNATCAMWFPPEGQHRYGSELGGTVEMTNARTGGWDFTGKQRIFFATGELDPWREAGVASHFRPGGPFQGTKDTPSIIIKGARHCDDMLLSSGDANADIAAAQKQIIAQFVEWTKEFYTAKGQRA